MTRQPSWLPRWASPRRTVLKAGLATLSLPLLARAGVLPRSEATAFGSPLQAAPRMPGLALAVVDSRHPIGAPFGVALQQAGVALHAIDGDVGALWFDTLAPRLEREADTWVAGFSAVNPLLCLEQMAADHWLGTRIRIEHRSDGGRLQHQVSAPEALLRPIGRVLERSADWQAELARLFSACTPDALATPRAECGVRSQAAPAQPLQATLVSWLIGPTRI